METDTRSQILEAARAEFIEKGYAATRMRSIAERAEINKGLLHYYFKTKEALIVEIFSSTFSEVFTDLDSIFNSDLSIKKMIQQSVDTYLDFLLKNPGLPGFIIQEMGRDPQRHIKRMKQAKFALPFNKLTELIKVEQTHGKIDPSIKAEHFTVSMLSLLLFPILARPMIRFAHNIDDKSYNTFIQQHKSSVSTMLINSLYFKQEA